MAAASAKAKAAAKKETKASEAPKKKANIAEACLSRGFCLKAVCPLDDRQRSGITPQEFKAVDSSTCTVEWKR